MISKPLTFVSVIFLLNLCSTRVTIHKFPRCCSCNLGPTYSKQSKVTRKKRAGWIWCFLRSMLKALGPPQQCCLSTFSSKAGSDERGQQKKSLKTKKEKKNAGNRWPAFCKPVTVCHAVTCIRLSALLFSSPHSSSSAVYQRTPRVAMASWIAISLFSFFGVQC